MGVCKVTDKILCEFLWARRIQKATNKKFSNQCLVQQPLQKVQEMPQFFMF